MFAHLRLMGSMKESQSSGGLPDNCIGPEVNSKKLPAVLRRALFRFVRRIRTEGGTGLNRALGFVSPVGGPDSGGFRKAHAPDGSM